MATLADLQSRQTEIRSRLQEIDADAAGERFAEAQTAEWNELNDEFERNIELIKELEARAQRIDRLTSEGSVEKEPESRYSRGRPKLVPDDATDLAAYRTHARDVDQLHDGYLEGALSLIEQMQPADARANRDASKERVDQLLRYTDKADERALARRIIATSNPVYQRAFGKYVTSGKDFLTNEESRALSLTAGSGGYAVPYTLDPTVIIVSGGARNPIRDLARIETITGNNWIGITSTGVTASYSAAATETSDNAPTLVQPSLNVEKAQAFIPFDIEIGQDWGSLQSEMARLLGDAKNRLESTEFQGGLGHTSNAPQGLLVGATAVVSSATTATFAVADLYSLRNGLGQQWHDNATIVGNRAAFDKVRQFDTAGGASLWVQLQYGAPATLLGYPAREWSAYSSALTTTGSTVLTIGDFSNFLIVDRVGMDVELIPHLFSTANNRPSGQRGLYCYWRNSSLVLTPGLQANSAFVSLKLL